MPTILTARLRPLLVAIALTLAAAAAAQTEYEGVRDPALQHLARQLQRGQQDAARRDLAGYLERFPGDGVMQYNLACLLAAADQPDSALARLERAFAAGYRDLERTRLDPDLATLQDDPRLTALLERTRERWLQTMLAAEVALEEGRWSEPLDLAPDPLGPGDQAAPGRLRLRHDTEALDLAITPPPAGADEAIVTVALPRSLEEPESRRWFEFRVALDAPGPVARIARHGRREPLAAAGSLTRGEEGAWLVRLPWSSLHPHRPPVELLLGVNVVLRRETATVPAGRWALVRDPFAASTVVPWRRFAPAVLDPGPDPAPAVAGRLDTYLVVGDSVSVELGVQGLRGGEVRIAQGVNDRPDTTFTTQLDPELAYRTLFFRLPPEPATGWFELSATVAPAAGPSLAWHDRGFRLHPDWYLEQSARLDSLPAPERPIVQYQLLSTLRGQQDFQPHDDPAHLAAAALLAGELLDRAAAAGSVLPAGPTTLEAAFPLGEDALQACELVLPEREQRERDDLVVVVTSTSELARAVARELAAARPAQDSRCYLVTPVRLVPGRPDLAVASIQDAAAWGQELLGCPGLRLVSTAEVQPLVLQASRELAWTRVPTLLLGGELAAPPPAHVTLGGPVAPEPGAWAAAIVAWD